MIAWIALVALGLRSLFPVGYMPDFSGHGLLVMCDGTDHHAAMGSDPHSGHMGHGAHGHDHASVCPFSAGGTYNAEGIKAPLTPPPVYARAVTAILARELLARQAGFSNASPRSPPFFS